MYISCSEEFGCKLVYMFSTQRKSDSLRQLVDFVAGFVDYALNSPIDFFEEDIGVADSTVLQDLKFGE